MAPMKGPSSLSNLRPSSAGNSCGDDDDGGAHIPGNRNDNRGQQGPEVHIPDNSRDDDGGDGGDALQKTGPYELLESC